MKDPRRCIHNGKLILPHVLCAECGIKLENVSAKQVRDTLHSTPDILAVLNAENSKLENSRILLSHELTS